jgi:hypothetical protein
MTPLSFRTVRMQLVKKERASAVEAMIVNMALQGSMDTKINEGKLIEMLEGIVGAQQQKNADAGKINIQRKKYMIMTMICCRITFAIYWFGFGGVHQVHLNLYFKEIGFL